MANSGIPRTRTTGGPEVQVAILYTGLQKLLRINAAQWAAANFVKVVFLLLSVSKYLLQAVISQLKFWCIFLETPVIAIILGVVNNNSAYIEEKIQVTTGIYNSPKIYRCLQVLTKLLQLSSDLRRIIASGCKYLQSSKKLQVFIEITSGYFRNTHQNCAQNHACYVTGYMIKSSKLPPCFLEE